MPLELIQQCDDAIALLRLTAQFAQVNLQLGNQLINRYQCLTSARTAFLFVRNEMLSQNGYQQGLLQIQPLPTHKGVRPVILLGYLALANGNKYQPPNLVDPQGKVEGFQNSVDRLDTGKR